MCTVPLPWHPRPSHLVSYFPGIIPLPWHFPHLTLGNAPVCTPIPSHRGHFVSRFCGAIPVPWQKPQNTGPQLRLISALSGIRSFLLPIPLHDEQLVSLFKGAMPEPPHIAQVTIQPTGKLSMTTFVYCSSTTFITTSFFSPNASNSGALARPADLPGYRATLNTPTVDRSFRARMASGTRGSKSWKRVR